MEVIYNNRIWAYARLRRVLPTIRAGYHDDHWAFCPVLEKLMHRVGHTPLPLVCFRKGLGACLPWPIPRVGACFTCAHFEAITCCQHSLHWRCRIANKWEGALPLRCKPQFCVSLCLLTTYCKAFSYVGFIIDKIDKDWGVYKSERIGHKVELWVSFWALPLLLL